MQDIIDWYKAYNILHQLPVPIILLFVNNKMKTREKHANFQITGEISTGKGCTVNSEFQVKFLILKFKMIIFSSIIRFSLLFYLLTSEESVCPQMYP